MRFLADMGISLRVLDQLRLRGHSATHLSESGLHDIADERVLEVARQENRIVLTHDLDFARILALNGDTTPSVVVFRLSDMRAHNVLTHLDIVLKNFPEDLGNGAIVSVGDRTFRCRSLPFDRSD